MLFGRKLNLEAIDEATKVNVNVYVRKEYLCNILEHIWNRGRKEYFIEFREYHEVNVRKLGLGDPNINICDLFCSRF